MMNRFQALSSVTFCLSLVFFQGSNAGCGRRLDQSVRSLLAVPECGQGFADQEWLEVSEIILSGTFCSVTSQRPLHNCHIGFQEATEESLAIRTGRKPPGIHTPADFTTFSG
jgi:hypothetical protein